ncbi:MAG TPA: hypothetical protein VFQ13_04795, partial [Anaerolineales bacterium]|nr:hypothetical protein [Anaerolineales bacterium]
EALALTLLRCYKLAMAVLHMPDSQTRAQDIDSYRKTDRQVQQAFQHFRENEKNFLAAGRPAYELWKRICTLERYFHVITKNSIERKTWLAKWAFEHGLNRLTEVSDQQLYEVEGTLMKLNEILLNRAAELDQMGADAEALLKYLQGKSIHLEHRSKVEEMLKALVMLRQGITAWKKEATEFLPLESEWRAWQVRKMMAEKLEREGKL